MGGQVGRVGHAHISYYARARVIPDHLVCPIDYPSMPLSISHSMPGFCWRDIGHKALCPISQPKRSNGMHWHRISLRSIVAEARLLLGFYLRNPLNQVHQEISFSPAGETERNLPTVPRRGTRNAAESQSPARFDINHRPDVMGAITG